MLLFLDCETRSELDLPEVGTYRYLGHPSTELLMIAYAFGEEPVKLWEPHKEKIPKDLEEGLKDDLQMICAWNSNFERTAFRILLGFEIPIGRFEDPAIRARYMSMPGKQEKVGKILDIDHKKLIEKARSDESIISFFCSPLSMGGMETLFGIEPTTYRDWDTHPREWERLCARCIVDVEGMREIYHRMSKYPLPDWEYDLYELDQRINDNGVYTDGVLLQGATLIVEREQEVLRKEFKALTGVANPRSTPQVLAFVRSHGYTFPSIGKAFVGRALAGECHLDEQGKKALELRKQISKSSVAKLESCKNSVQPDGRVRGLFNFMGAARTGRWTSGLFQAHNLIKATKEVEKKFDLALNLLRAGDYDAIRSNFSSPLDVACSSLRPVLRAPSGSRLVIADLSAIESRGAGWVSGCQTLMDIFIEGKDPYCYFASLMDPTRTYEDFFYEFDVLKNKTNRNNAKPPFLGCFGRGTRVVTNNGIKAIEDITKEDLLWDGLQWVKHDGVVYQGDKLTINLFGVNVTPEHKILCGCDWREAWEVNQSTLLGNRATNLALGSFSEGKFEIEETAEKSIRTYVNALAGQKSGIYEQILSPEKLQYATFALGRRLLKKETASIRDLTILENSLIGLRTDITQFCLAVEELVRLDIGTVVGELSADLKTYIPLLNIAYLCLTTINLSINLIEQIITGITSGEIYDSSRQKLINEIKSVLSLLNIKVSELLESNSGNGFAPHIKTLALFTENSVRDLLYNRSLQNKLDARIPTFDVLNCGPNNRFTILTDSGPMIVHNCGYGLGPGDIEYDEEGNMVKTGLLKYGSDMGIELSKEYAEKAVMVYRNRFKEVCDFWYDLQRAFIKVVENDAVAEVGPLRLDKLGRVLRLWLPSGRALHYIDPEVRWEKRVSQRTGREYKAAVITIAGIDQKTHQWSRIDTKGSKLFENVVQAICRDILGLGMLAADKMGFKIVLHCHDEIVAEVPYDSPLTVDDLIRVMSITPDWGPGFLIGAAGFETEYYKKD